MLTGVGNNNKNDDLLAVDDDDDDDEVGNAVTNNSADLLTAVAAQAATAMVTNATSEDTIIYALDDSMPSDCETEDEENGVVRSRDEDVRMCCVFLHLPATIFVPSNTAKLKTEDVALHFISMLESLYSLSL